MKTRQAACPTCSKVIHINEEPLIGQRVTCPICHDEHEVIDLSPLRLTWTCEDILEDPAYSYRCTPPRNRRGW